jgi:hypothetical protein
LIKKIFKNKFPAANFFVIFGDNPGSGTGSGRHWDVDLDAQLEKILDPDPH